MSEVLAEYENVKIIRTEDQKMPYYIVLAPEFSEAENSIIENARNIISDYSKVMKEVSKLHSSTEKEAFLRTYLKEKIAQTGKKIENTGEVVSRLIDKIFLGYGRLGPLIRDENLEEVMVNGIGTPVYVVHRHLGMCATNISYETPEPLDDMIAWLSNYVGRPVNEESPLLDAHMPDGSRANVAIPPAAPYGPAVTIRKFKKKPYTILDLIELGTLNYELAGFLWLCVEGFGLNPMEIVIAGGAGSGKTTLLNAMAMFIPRTERIVTVEDTLELNFEFLQNWVPLEASSATTSSKKMSMDNLLKNSLRMRPDRVIVGEVRGNEAETLFVAMDIGLQGSMGTIHSNNARETTIRLMGEPMNVPIRMIPLLDLIVVTHRIFDRKRGLIRRVTEVTEVAGVEKDVVQLGVIYSYDQANDEIRRSEYPILLKEKMAKACGVAKKRLDKEILIRSKILEYMVGAGIRETSDVIDFFNKYHTNPKAVIEGIKASGFTHHEED
ncbi:MAG TPA: CpaF family protein [Candidatus Altiarchaeales archaeon]|nr:CpaF family protein [Candidatus Altiarchaeales archaeon]